MLLLIPEIILSVLKICKHNSVEISWQKYSEQFVNRQCKNFEKSLQKQNI